MLLEAAADLDIDLARSWMIGDSDIDAEAGRLAGCRTILVENPYSGAPHGAKGVGELPMDVPAAAVVAAIHDATGVWIHDLPASPERVIAAIHGIQPPPLPGISTVSDRSTTPQPSAADAGAPQEGLDPRPDALTDPQPLRGPHP